MVVKTGFKELRMQAPFIPIFAFQWAAVDNLIKPRSSSSNYQLSGYRQERGD
jgi:hypothetical protein